MNLYDLYRQRLELGLDAVALDKQLTRHVQQVLIHHELLDPPADGLFGPLTTRALHKFQHLVNLSENWLGYKTAKALIETPTNVTKVKTLQLGSSFADRIVRAMMERGYYVARNPGEINIVYLEGVNLDGRLNDDAPNQFNDLRLVISCVDTPRIIGKWEATTEPGTYYTQNPVNPGGAARIKFGQYKAWKVDTHWSRTEPHAALVQAKKILVYRDRNKDMLRTGDKLHSDASFVNQHHGFDYPRKNIAFASAGCLVGRTRSGHFEFMNLVKRDSRYRANKNYLFYTAIMDGAWVQ